jgi:hypothetical protein
MKTLVAEPLDLRPLDRSLEQLSQHLQAQHIRLTDDDPNIQRTAIVDLRSTERLSDQILVDIRNFTDKELQLTLGGNAVRAARFLRDPYDFVRAHYRILEPGGAYPIIRKRTILERNIPKKSLLGHFYYFDFATIGRTLFEGGSLSIVDKSDA